MPERFVLLGLARPRGAWFTSVARWANAGSIPVEFLKCVSTAELLARLASGRRHTAVLIDGTLPGLDRDFVEGVRSRRVALLVVDDARADHWRLLGASAVLPSTFDRDQLVEAIRQHGERTDALVRGGSREERFTGFRAPVAAVCGTGGSGASTVSMALAQGMASRPGSGRVVLADLRRTAELGMLHDIRDLAPGVQELVDAHRSGVVDEDVARRCTFELPDHSYHVLLGLRRARYWSTIRTRAFEAAFDTLRRSFDLVVCDTDAATEPLDDHPDGEDPSLFARVSTKSADAILVVGTPGTKGVHALARAVVDLLDAGAEPARVLPVVNRASRSPRARAELARAVTSLVAEGRPRAPIGPVVFLPVRRVEEAVRAAAPMPAPLPALLADAFAALRAHAGQAADRGEEAELVAPGSLGIGEDAW